MGYNSIPEGQPRRRHYAMLTQRRQKQASSSCFFTQASGMANRIPATIVCSIFLTNLSYTQCCFLWTQVQERIWGSGTYYHRGGRKEENRKKREIRRNKRINRERERSSKWFRDRPKLYFSFSAETKLAPKLTFWFGRKRKRKRNCIASFGRKRNQKRNWINCLKFEYTNSKAILF